MVERRIVVIGAGVAGLTTALLLSKISGNMLTVVAKHMPGDYDIEYASPWAGANYMPVSVSGTAAAEWDKNTWPFLKDLAHNHPEAGVHYQECRIYTRRKDIGSATAKWFADLLSPNPWWKNVVPKFRLLSRSELRDDIDHGTCFMSVCINTAIYLPWLLSQCLKQGVIFKRGVFQHVVDATKPGVHHSGRPADLVLNCTGLGARILGGVEDKLVHPARGQIVIVRNEAPSMYSASGTDDSPDEACYIMARAAGGGTILGGCYQKDRWESQPDPNLAIRIMERCIRVCPGLTDGKGIEHLDIIRHGVGLRPAREGGARIELEYVQGIPVVHLYGTGGAGYQCSYGSSLAAVKLVDQAFANSGPKL